MIAAFDLDGTLLKKNSSFAFCRFLTEQGFFSQLDLFFCVSIYLRHCYFGLSLGDLHSLVFKRLFKGKSVTTLSSFLNPFIEKKIASLWYPPAVNRLQMLKNQGVKCLVLSNSPRFLTAPLAQMFGVTEVFATDYQTNDKNELTQISSLMDGPKKAEILSLFPLKKTIAFSDSYLDLPFLQAAHTAVAVNPKRRLKKYAKQKGWEVL